MNDVVTTDHGRSKSRGTTHTTQSDLQVDSELMTLAPNFTSIWSEEENVYVYICVYVSSKFIY